MVDRFVDPVAADRKPVVNASEGREDVPLDAGFLGDFPYRGLLVVFLALRMALGQAPFQTSAAVKAGNNRNPHLGVGRVHYNAAG